MKEIGRSKWWLYCIAGVAIIMFFVDCMLISSEQGTLVIDENNNYYVLQDDNTICEFTISKNAVIISLDGLLSVSGMETGDRVLVGLWQRRYETNPGCLSNVHYVIQLEKGNDLEKKRAISSLNNLFFKPVFGE